MHGFKDLVDDLQGKPSLISEFLIEPEKVISRYNVNKREAEALLSGDAESLINLDPSDGLVAGVLSGAHSSRCAPGRATSR